MRTDRLRGALEHLCLADGGGLTDGQLLARFIDGREEAAFAALVRRHGPMVLGVCRRLVGNVHDAEDAFQATFLVLARKAASVVRREAVGGFLYGVAYRTALRARARAARRRAMETQVDELPHPEAPPAEAQDWRPVLDRELNRLPEKYRAAVLLCDLEGRTRREAARQLGVPEGTLASRLATARRMLARRLARCGVLLSGGALAAALAGGASAAVPAGLAVATAKAAARVAAGSAAGAAAPAVALMNEVLRAMLMTKLKTYVVAGLAAVLLGAGGIAYRAAGQAPRSEARPLTELELLRREVDILKLQMELVQEKQRAQEAELRTLKGRHGPTGPASGSTPWARPPAAKVPTGAERTSPPYRDSSSPSPADARPAEEPTPKAKSRPPATGPVPETRAPSADAILRLPGDGPAVYVPVPQARPEPVTPPDLAPSPTGPPVAAPPDEGTASSADRELDAAVKAFREARDEGARQRALDAMEKALRNLRQQQRPALPPAAR